MVEVYEEADIRAALRDGGQVLGAIIVARSDEDFVVYIRGNWVRGRGFRVVQSYRGLSDARIFKNLQSAWCFIRKFDFLGHVRVYRAGDPALREFVSISPRDLGEGHTADAAALDVPHAGDGGGLRTPELGPE